MVGGPVGAVIGGAAGAGVGTGISKGIEHREQQGDGGEGQEPETLF
jgi:hypothetical protein